MQADTLILDVKSNPELAAYFQRKEAGDECTLRVKTSLDENANGIVKLSVSEVEIEAFRDKEKETESTEEEVPPVMSMADHFETYDDREARY